MTALSLHIGLNYVNPDAYNGWDGELAGCINDARDFRQLATNLGYDTTLKVDDQATSHSILREISQAARLLRSGDIFLITYSGHGGQVNDATAEEEDGLDETWVLWDRQVIDDELFSVYGQFEEGVRIFVISDSCHSGTVARMMLYQELSKTRATNDNPMPDHNGKTRSLPTGIAFELAHRDRAMYDTVQYIAGRDAETSIRASLILISGCQDNQLSYDGVDNGLFTGTFLNTWNSGRFSGSYRELHSEIVDQMPPYQTPNFFTLGPSTSVFERQNPFTISAPSGTTQPQDPPSNNNPVTPQPVDRPTLRRGDSGDAVSELQRLLNGMGYDLVADGFFGRGTSNAIKRFQRSQGLGADGVVGKTTWSALLSGQDTDTPSDPDLGPDTGSPTTPNRPVIRRGDRGDAVVKLQNLLIANGFRLRADGVFGPRTASYVRSFQRSNNLRATGIVDQATWEELEANS